MQSIIENIISQENTPIELKTIAKKVVNSERITADECLYLYEKTELGILGTLANYVRNKRNGTKTFFNKNFHIEPTNICSYNCVFCSYSRRPGDPTAWEFSIDEMLEIVEKYKDTDVSEVHIVGGVHPKRDLYFYGELLQKIKQIIPKIHIKAFTAVELDFMIKKAGLGLEEGLKKLKEFGLDSIPGGGAEIFNEDIRKQICHEKSSSDMWLRVHKTAHSLGIPSNATMLYGHIETYQDRINHIQRLREMQDETGMFNAFIPLKYKSQNNELSYIGEVNLMEDLKQFAISRIFLDNIPHIKAYWPMLGKETTQLTLSFGVDDIDGTIDDSTKIYSMAGSSEQKPQMNTEEIIKLIKQVNQIPVERDTIYNEIRRY